MPTANTKAPKATKTRAKAAAKPAAAKARRASQAKRPQAKAAQAKTTSARTTHKATSPFEQAQTATRDTAGAVGEYAERAVLIPVGAALIARERVASSVSDTISIYSSSTKTQAQLRKFERRGTTARNRLEREVRKARVRVERELRQRRKEIESTVSELDERREAIAKNSAEIAGRVPELANRVPEIASRVQERILTLV
jgi:hypothetical protein